MIKIKKIVILLFCFVQILYSATAEQIENYLSLSRSDAQLINIEQVFDSMRGDEDNSTQEINQIYTHYLEEHLSSNELEELLELYRIPIMQRYVIEMDIGEIPTSEMNSFLNSLKENPLSTERSEIVEKILEQIIDEKQILAFYASMTQRYRQKNNKENNESKKITQQEKNFLNMMKTSEKNSLLYGTQVLSIEEMQELDQALHSSIISKVKKVESNALIHVMNTFIQNMVSKPKDSNESN
jgi:hypothetical protein